MFHVFVAYHLRSLCIPFEQQPVSRTKISWLAPFLFFFFFSSLPSIRKNVHAAAYIRPDSGIRIHVAEYTVQMPSVAAKGLPPGGETIFQGWINDLRHGCLSTDTTASHRYIWEGKRRGGGNAVPRYDRRKDRRRRLDDNVLRGSRGKKTSRGGIIVRLNTRRDLWSFRFVGGISRGIKLSMLQMFMNASSGHWLGVECIFIYWFTKFSLEMLFLFRE